MTPVPVVRWCYNCALARPRAGGRWIINRRARVWRCASCVARARPPLPVDRTGTGDDK